MANDVWGPMRRNGIYGYDNNDEWTLAGSKDSKKQFLESQKNKLETYRTTLAELKGAAYKDEATLRRIKVLEDRIIPNLVSGIALEESRLNLR